MKLITTLITATFFCLLIIAGCGGGGTSTVANSTSWASLGIAGGSQQNTISWVKTAAKATGTSSSTIYWSTSPGVTKRNGNKLANVTSPYLHTGLANGTMYYYVVTETVSGIEGSESLEIATAPQAVLPLTTTGVSVAPLNGAVQIKIDRTGAATTTKFNLYWSKAADFKAPTKISNAFGTLTTFQHTGLTNGTMYYYAVTAEGPDGESPLSSAVAAMPLADISATNYQVSASVARIATPNAVTAVAANQLATLSWNLPIIQLPTIFDPAATPTQAPVISFYTIYWSPAFITDTTKANKIKVPVAAKAKPPLTFVHNTGLVNKTPYYYLITAVADVDANGNPLRTVDGTLLTFESLVSSQIMVQPEAKAPVAPAGFSATSGKQQVTLGWAKAATTSGAAIYTIYASTVAPARPEDLVTAANRIATSSAAPYVHSGLQNGNTYYYAITATTEAESTMSSVIAVALW